MRWIRSLGFGSGCDCPAAQVDADSEPHRVHDLHRSRQMLRGAIDMLMQVDEALLRPPLIGLGIQLERSRSSPKRTRDC